MVSGSGLRPRPGLQSLYLRVSRVTGADTPTRGHGETDAPLVIRDADTSLLSHAPND